MWKCRQYSAIHSRLCWTPASFSKSSVSAAIVVTMAHYKGAASEGGRAMQLMKAREKALEEIEFRKKKIEDELKISSIENKFAAHYDAVEQQLKVGGCFGIQ